MKNERQHFYSDRIVAIVTSRRMKTFLLLTRWDKSMLGSEMKSHEIESAFTATTKLRRVKRKLRRKVFFKHIFFGLFVDRWSKIYQNVNNRQSMNAKRKQPTDTHQITYFLADFPRSFVEKIRICLWVGKVPELVRGSEIRWFTSLAFLLRDYLFNQPLWSHFAGRSARNSNFLRISFLRLLVAHFAFRRKTN